MAEENKTKDPMPPPDATPEEIGEFWDTHSLADYWDETHEVEFEVNLKSRQNPTPNAPAQKKDISMSDETKPDLPTNPEDTSNTALDVVTDLALDSTIPAPIRKNAFKAFDRLCSALIDVPVGALERRAAEKRVESEARIKIRDEITTQITQQVKVNPEYALRAGHKYAEKIIREQLNLDKISAIAVDELNKAESMSSTEQHANSDEEKTIDDEWLNNFENEARPKSTEEMQTLFGSILAGEIRKPGSYSIRTVKVLSQLDQDVAVLFKKLCSVCIVYKGSSFNPIVSSLGSDPASNGLLKYGLGFEELNLLNEYNLIISSYNYSRSYETYILGAVNQSASIFFPFQYQGKGWILSSLPDREGNSVLRISGVAPSRVGRELFRIVDHDPMPEYTEDLKKFFLGQKLQMVESPTSGPTILRREPNE